MYFDTQLTVDSRNENWPNSENLSLKLSLHFQRNRHDNENSNQTWVTKYTSKFHSHTDGLANHTDKL